MRAQTTEYHCGPAALQNAMRALGRHVSQTRVARLAGTNPEDGTTEYGLQSALDALGAVFLVVATSDPRQAKGRLWGSLWRGGPAVLCVDRWSHWVAVIGVCGHRPVVVDSARTPHLVRENHVVMPSPDRFLARWAASRRTRGQGPKYYALLVQPDRAHAC